MATEENEAAVEIEAEEMQEVERADSEGSAGLEVASPRPDAPH
jgi:hypothetical protein